MVMRERSQKGRTNRSNGSMLIRVADLISDLLCAHLTSVAEVSPDTPLPTCYGESRITVGRIAIEIEDVMHRYVRKSHEDSRANFNYHRWSHCSERKATLRLVALL